MCVCVCVKEILPLPAARHKARERAANEEVGKASTIGLHASRRERYHTIHARAGTDDIAIPLHDDSIIARKPTNLLFGIERYMLCTH